MTEKKPKDALEAAVKEEAGQAITVLGEKFPLVKKLTVLATHSIYKAQREEDLSLLIEAASNMVDKQHRKKFLDLLLSEPDGDDEELTMEDFNDLFQDAIEKIGGRPLEQS
jgi:hypothetical protein